MTDKQVSRVQDANSLEEYCIGDLLDDETGEVVHITTDDAALAHRYVNVIAVTTQYKALALQQLADRKLYLAFGYGTFKAFVEEHLQMSYRSAKEYVRVGRRLAPSMPELASGKDPGTALVKAVEDENVAQIGQLGIKKMLELVKFEEPVFEEVVEKGEFVVGDTTYTLDDLREMRSRDVAKLRGEMRDLRRKHSTEVTQLQEQLKQLKSEHETEREKVKEAEEALKRAEHLERLYSQQELSYTQQRAAVTEIADTVALLRRQVANAGIEETEDPTIAEPLGDALRGVYTIWQHITVYYEWAIDQDAPMMVTESFYNPSGNGQ